VTLEVFNTSRRPKRSIEDGVGGRCESVHCHDCQKASKKNASCDKGKNAVVFRIDKETTRYIDFLGHIASVFDVIEIADSVEFLTLSFIFLGTSRYPAAFIKSTKGTFGHVFEICL
jgi:hypothetical protein